MLLPHDIHPKRSLYYNGAIILEYLKQDRAYELFDLLIRIREEHDMCFSTYMLSLDWLYLIEAARVNSSGLVERCHPSK